MRIDVLTLFPEMFAGVLGSSILRRATEAIPDPAAPDDADRVRPPVCAYHLHNLREWSKDQRHHKVDDAPFGGGPGMVIRSDIVWDAVSAVQAKDDAPPRRVFLSPQGRPLTQRVAEELAEKPRLLLLCGHYEGIDERALDRMRADGGLDEISVGDYVLSGGELPAMTLIDAVVRLLPGALGHAESAHQDSFSPGAQRLLDHPHYTKPREWEGRAVPDVLLSGNHAAIETWRQDQARQRTEQRRPDLLTGGSSQDQLPAVTLRETDPGGADGDAVALVHQAAFETDAEAQLTKALSAAGVDPIGVVAELNGEVVGHTVLSEMTLRDEQGIRGLLALGPIAVKPVYQRRGIGSALVREAIRQAKLAGVARLFVLGDPNFYGRFGFEPAGPLGYSNDFHDGNAFQVLTLRSGKRIPAGHVLYAEPFNALK